MKFKDEENLKDQRLNKNLSQKWLLLESQCACWISSNGGVEEGCIHPPAAVTERTSIFFNRERKFIKIEMYIEGWQEILLKIHTHTQQKRKEKENYSLCPVQITIGLSPAGKRGKQLWNEFVWCNHRIIKIIDYIFFIC